MKTQKSMITLMCVFMMILICSCLPADSLDEVGIATDNGLENLATSNTPTMSPEATAQPGLTSTVSQTEIIVETSVTPTIISVVTKSGMNQKANLFFFHPTSGYLSLEFDNGEINLVTLSEPDISPPSNIPAPGGALYLAFANYEDLIVYWKGSDPEEIWISNLTLEENTLIYTDRDENYQLEFDYFPYSELNFYWSPAERYLILDFNSDDLEDMIVDRETQITQNWNYECNRIARSPRTENWALWCVSTNPFEEAYAVIESDDTLWISIESPIEILVNKDELRQNIWRWSPDRQKIAFFDPNDTTGSLHIAEGTRINHILPGSYFEFADALQYTQPDPIQWSGSGDLLLIYGRDPENQACPKWKDEFGSGNTYTNVPCWQIVNSQSGDIVWQIVDSIELIENKAAEIFPTFTYDSASISPDGTHVAASYSSGGFRNLFVADIQTGQIISSGWPISPISMRWENE